MIAGGLLALGLVNAVVMIDVHFYGKADHAAPADVIAVLGAGIEDDFRATDAFRRRTQHAVALWRAGYAPYIICSGGYPVSHPLPEAQSCVDVAVGMGVPRNVVFMESSSRSTEENAIYIKRLMEARGWRTVLVVTDDFHVFRTEFLFGEHGVPMTGISPAQASTGPIRLDEYLVALTRESLAIDWQTLKTILGLPYTYVPGLLVPGAGLG